LLNLGLSSKFEEVSEEFSEFLHITVDILSFFEDFLLVILKVGGNCRKVLQGIREDSHILLDWGNIEFRWSPNMFASWESRFELLVSSIDSDANSYKITNFV